MALREGKNYSPNFLSSFHRVALHWHRSHGWVLELRTWMHVNFSVLPLYRSEGFRQSTDDRLSGAGGQRSIEFRICLGKSIKKWLVGVNNFWLVSNLGGPGTLLSSPQALPKWREKYFEEKCVKTDEIITKPLSVCTWLSTRFEFSLNIKQHFFKLWDYIVATTNDVILKSQIFLCFSSKWKH